MIYTSLSMYFDRLRTLVNSKNQKSIIFIVVRLEMRQNLLFFRSRAIFVGFGPISLSFEVFFFDFLSSPVFLAGRISEEVMYKSLHFENLFLTFYLILFYKILI